jgi:hypothetical protein
MVNYFTDNEIRVIAEANGVSLKPKPCYNTAMTFKRFFTVNGELFAKQAMSRLRDDASYFLCNEFVGLGLSHQSTHK